MDKAHYKHTYLWIHFPILCNDTSHPFEIFMEVIPSKRLPQNPGQSLGSPLLPSKGVLQVCVR